MAKVAKAVSKGKGAEAPQPVPGIETSWEESGLGQEFEKLVVARQQAADTIKRAEIIKKETSAKILSVMVKSKLAKITELNEFMVIRSKGMTASKIEASKLLAAGVTSKQIEAGTTPGSPYEYIQVRKSDKEEE